jgi:hypothetical protein
MDGFGRWAMNPMLIKMSTRNLGCPVRPPAGDLPTVAGDGCDRTMPRTLGFYSMQRRERPSRQEHTQQYDQRGPEHDGNQLVSGCLSHGYSPRSLITLAEVHGDLTNEMAHCQRVPPAIKRCV